MPRKRFTNEQIAFALRQTASLDWIAAEVSYQSQGTLSRAFLRKYDVRPGSLPREAGIWITQMDQSYQRRRRRTRFW